MSAHRDIEEAASERVLQLLIERFGVAALEGHAGAIYVVDADWRLHYMNPAWSRFAAENGGEPAIGRRYTRGSSLLDAFASDELRDFYVTNYSRCRETGRLWRHEYDCSAPDLPRRFQQLVYPLPGGHLLIVNSRRIDTPEFPAAASTVDGSCTYRDVHGLIHQCAHCRRVCTAADDSCWDWVPDWAREIPLSASHTFCPTCAGFFYPPPRRR